MLIMICLMLGFSEKTALFLEEEVNVYVGEVLVDKYSRSIYVGKHRVRVDFPKSNLRLIYDMGLHTLWTIDLDKRRYFYARSSDSGKLARLPLSMLAVQTDGQLEHFGPIVRRTGERKKIEGWTCSEYLVEYPKSYHITTKIWTTKSLWAPPNPLISQFQSRKTFRLLWYAALGTEPPFDVRKVMDKLFDKLGGFPIRTVTTAGEEGQEFRTVSTIVSISRESDIDPTFFEIPPHFEVIRNNDVVTDRPWKMEQN